jgi:hypothetical protein
LEKTKRFAETIEEFSGHFGKSLVAEKKGGESPQGSRMQRHCQGSLTCAITRKKKTNVQVSYEKGKLNHKQRWICWQKLGLHIWRLYDFFYWNGTKLDQAGDSFTKKSRDGLR